jgi:hypothetical protein
MYNWGRFFNSGGGAMEFSDKSLKNAIIVLWKIQNDIQETASTAGIEAAKGHLGKLLDKT